jgi:sortase A
MAKKTRNTSKKAWIVRIAAIILLIIGLGMIFNSQIRDLMVRQNQTTALKKLNKETVKKNQAKKGMFDFSKVEEIDFGKVTKSRVNNTADAIGAIAIPSVKMYLPIMKG